MIRINLQKLTGFGYFQEPILYLPVSSSHGIKNQFQVCQCLSVLEMQRNQYFPGSICTDIALASYTKSKSTSSNAEAVLSLTSQFFYLYHSQTKNLSFYYGFTGTCAFKVSTYI